MNECIFCKIVAGGIPAAKVHEDAQTLAFLDIRPLAEGHALVVPKRHARRIEDMTPADAAALMHTVQVTLGKLTRGLKAPAATVAVNDGAEAGQEVPHVHIHVVPRHVGDGAGPIHALNWPRPSTTPDAVSALAKRLASA